MTHIADMARPVVLTVKKLIALTEGMAKSIDEFRFAARIGSESEAIRRLLASGLKVQAQLRETIASLAWASSEDGSFSATTEDGFVIRVGREKGMWRSAAWHKADPTLNIEWPPHTETIEEAQAAALLKLDGLRRSPPPEYFEAMRIWLQSRLTS